MSGGDPDGSGSSGRAGDSDGIGDPGETGARYRFAVTFRVASTGVSLDPDTFSATMTRPAAEPGTGDWLFFRDNLWRGELADPAHARRLASDALGEPVLDVEYRAFECSPAHREALESAVAEALGEFRADSVEAALSKYFGSTIEVVETD
ncbi:MAG: LWR-salt protein [Halobacteriaceae archaeon]